MNDRLLQSLIKVLQEIQTKHLPKLRQQFWRLRVKALRKQPAQQLKLAEALLKSGQPQAAIDLCKVLEAPQSPFFGKSDWRETKAQIILADAYQAIGQWQDAIGSHQKAIELEPSNAELHHSLGKRYGTQEKWARAIEAYQKAIELESANPWFQYSLGIAWVKTGNWQMAVSTLQMAGRSLPREAWLNYFLGEALLAIGDTEAAIEVYKKTLRRSPWISYLRDCLNYAEHVRQQDKRIDEFCKKNKTKSSKRKMLMITPYPTYPPTTGAIARMFHEMKAMGEKYELTVVSFIFQKRDFYIEKQLADYCEFAVAIVMGDCPPAVTSQPKLIHRYSSERMAKVLEKLSQISFDFVLTDFIQMAQYHNFFPNAFHILGEHNIESELLRRSAQLQSQKQLQQFSAEHTAFQGFLGGMEEANLLAEYERSLWPKFPLRMVVSEPDRQILDRICGVGKTMVVSNGIDTKNIHLLPDNANKIVLFIGTLSYYPNVDGVQYFVEEILPLMWEHDPGVQFWIAGAEPPQVLLDFAIDQRIKVLANPEDMTEVARQCCVTVVPLRIGSGTRIKILHGMALGLPIVTTSLGCEGIEVTDGTELWIRDSPQAFATATLDLLKDADRRQQFRSYGRELVEAHYDWAAIFAAAIDRIEAEYSEDSLKIDSCDV